MEACTVEVRFEKNTPVHSSDEQCLGMLLLRKGELRVYMLSEDGREVTLYRLFSGDICVLSASCVLDAVAFEVMIHAEEETEALLIPLALFRRLRENNIYVEAFSYKTATERFSEVMWTMQQILFFRELDFPLKDIIKIMQNPDFDRISAFKKQKELLLLKRNRTDRLIQLLERLEKGEKCMSFKEFDLSEYIHALEDFKVNQTDTIIKHWGSVNNFDMLIQKIKDDEENVSKLAIQHFGSIEKYTEEMKYNLEHFSEIMDKEWNEEAEKIAAQSDLLYGKLTADLTCDVSSPQIQEIVYEILEFIKKQSSSVTLDKPLINILIDSYSNDYVKNITDKKYGDGASDYIVKAFRYYSENNTRDRFKFCVNVKN